MNRDSKSTTLFSTQNSTLCFDADDTLWENEPYFREAEQLFANLVADFVTEKEALKILFSVEYRNIEVYGYGIKSFTLSMIEAAHIIMKEQITSDIVEAILNNAKTMIALPVQLIDGVEACLKQLCSLGYKLIIATKGDLLDQRRKLRLSRLEHYFDHIEIMAEKQEENYKELLRKLHLSAAEFIMVGNSLKSDILPVINIGGTAVFVPFYTTWEHEKMKESDIEKPFYKISSLSALPALLAGNIKN